MKQRDLIITVVAIVVVGALCFGLATMKNHKLPFSGNTTSVVADGAGGATGTTGATSTDGDKVVMHVNGEPITEREFNLVYQQAVQQQPQFQGPNGRELLADQVAKMKALEQQASKMGFDTDPEIQARLKFDRASIASGFVLHKLVHPPTDAEVQAAYEKQKGQMEATELSHILIAYQGSAASQGRPAPPLELAMKKAEAIEAKLHQGADFEKMAKQVSDDTGSAPNGGKLGPVEHGVMPPEVETVAFALKPGEISKPVQSQYGIHIFKAGSRKTQTLEQVKPQLAQKLQQEALDKQLDDIKKGAKVELDPTFFAKNGTPPPVGRSQGMPPAIPQ